MFRRHRVATLAAIAATAALALAGCSSSSGSDSSTAPASDSSGSFPVTVQSALGDVTIESAPERIVTLGWGSNDALLSMGIAPVGMAKQSYGGDENGVLPWTQEAIDSLGAAEPTMITESDEPAYEEIQALKPDLILAVYSGLTQDQYDLLSQIAPTVAYPDAPWSTPWRDVVTTVGKAVGQEQKAADVLSSIDDEITTVASENPQFEGKSVAAAADFAGTFYGYSPSDPRVGFLNDLGFTNPQSVTDASTDGSFFFQLSNEKLDSLTSDVLVYYADSQESYDAWLATPAAQTMQQVKDGTVAPLIGTQLVASVSPPTALSLTWGLADTVKALDAAVANVK
ncbi:periplasmic binding protein [Cnuibacter physcomitrellae]|uniref:Iron ABC transporter substrate-binding protein n=1 Tax=Cnuibacter physcomitrellae TaxID=1619308 RepID=A0A1X9LUI6_9MICO|nr:iron-siderophore ABC transporter substrate-binding protein [Cnuibacter physcomitrellae]ARJ05670.1 iron ABC transporter substrate-binding protein [Cnuibacter physcomitrellae]GGI36222.1 periplasmic binding protein [Cnuibacter physcomitrellae]